MDYLQNFGLLLVGFVLAANGVLGFTVLLNDSKSKTNRAFFAFVLSSIPWGIFNYFIFQPLPEGFAIWVLRINVFFAVFYSFFLFRLFYVFPKAEVIFPKFYYSLILPVVILTAGLTLTPLVFERVISFSATGGIQQVQNGLGVALFGITVIALIGYSLFLLSQKVFRSQNKEEKKALRLVLIGVAITFVLHIVFNFVLPVVFDNPVFAPFGSLFIFPFIILTSYAVAKHRLFNVKVAGVSLLVFGLSIVNFFEILQAADVVSILYRGAVLFFILIFGILLIKGVLREIEQKEEIARMAEDVRRAYVVEKKAKEELERLDTFKDAFLQQTQHDLRTPLTSVVGYVDMLVKGMFGRQSRKSLEVLGKVRGLSDGMVKRANNFLDLAQFQLGKSVLAIKPGVSLKGILEEVKNELDFKADSKGVKLAFEEPPQDMPVSADREKLKAALFNIVDNAVKYTQEGSVAMSLKFENGSAVIRVKDTGIGIAPENIDGIFKNMFERTAEAKKTAAGAGIGLYLSAQIIREHKGRVSVSSPGVGKGSTFKIELPAGGGAERGAERKS